MEAAPGPKPTISHVTDTGTLIELIYDNTHAKTAFAICERNGDVTVASDYTLRSGAYLVPYRAENNLIASGCVLLPSEPGPEVSRSSLLTMIADYLDRYVDLSSEFRDLAAHYVLLTWVYDAFQELPYLRFRGDYGTGKTRALKALGSICHKPFFASGASTVSPIFHVLDAFQGTLILDEADLRFSDATAPLTKILNNGNVAGLPVLRTLTNRAREFDPKAFRVFGPKIIAMRERFEDVALESRFITQEMEPKALRDDIPIHTPADMAGEALKLRNALLTWRLKNRWSVRPEPSRQAPGVEARIGQVSLALASLMDDRAVLDSFHTLLAKEDARMRDERSRSMEGELLGAMLECWYGTPTAPISVSVIAQALSTRLDRAITPKAVGWMMRTRFRLLPRKSNGAYVLAPEDHAKVRSLAVRYGVADAGSADAATPTTPTNRSLVKLEPQETMETDPERSISI